MQFLNESFDETGAISTITEMQRAIHLGRAFSISGRDSLSSSGTDRFLFRTGDKHVHFMDAIFDFAEGNLDIFLYASPTVSNAGTAKSGVNLNQTVPIPTPTLSSYISPTVSPNGTELFSVAVMPTTKAPASAALAGGRVLNPNTDYLLSIVNLNSSVVVYGYTLIWQEI